ncbi:protein of unknown function [Moritella yayanosii]|uniref:Uncharacterized protein n=1 Tax=Moritella yayanosii TaxID=69539 RepID=A0A330LNU3_9GAMM|nr:protein of unknown function [Moritella yayanosii]
MEIIVYNFWRGLQLMQDGENIH